jgi:hypothetical protein
MIKPSRSVVAAVAGVALFGSSVFAAPVQTVWVIAMENHNWISNGKDYAQGGSLALKNNPAAYYINSLVNGTASASSQVAFANAYYAAGTGVHPSEPNYLWAEAGTSFNPISTGSATSTTKGSIVGATITSDSDPSAAAKNIFNIPHLTQQMNNSGITWKNYQEDYQISNSTTPTGGDPTKSKSGTMTGINAITNPYYNTKQYNYAVKHNPMAFFTDTQTQNVRTFDQLRSDISSNNFAQYNWITPNQYNDMHSAITGGFTYRGTAYTSDQAAVAIGDNFLATIVPQIMATDAYKNNGAIVLWWDETEGGDNSNYTIPEIVISPLAHPNVGGVPYQSTVSMNHSSDIKTMEEIFQLNGYLDNAIATTSYNTLGAGNFNTVSGSNDLSDLFASGVIPTTVPEPGALALIAPAALLVGRRRRA